MLLLVWVFLFVGVAIPIHFFAARLGLHLASPGAPQAPLETSNSFIHKMKPMILLGSMFTQSCFQDSTIDSQKDHRGGPTGAPPKAPPGPPGSPKRAPKAPQGSPKDPPKAPRSTQGAAGTPQGLTRSDQACPRGLKGRPKTLNVLQISAQEDTKRTQGQPKIQ